MRAILQHFDAVSEIDIYDRVCSHASASRLGRLKALRKQVSEAYAAYAGSPSASGLVSIIAAPKELDGQALKSNYATLRSGSEKDIAASLLRRSKRCCLCWHAPAGQLDHHLPRAAFPEFSVLTLNLVPVCARCNHVKLNKYRRADGGPSFLHAYRDQLPSTEQFLRATITLGATVAADFHVASTSAMSDSTFATLTSHFEALALAELYGELATELMVEKLTPFYEYFDHGGGEAVAQYLRSEARGVVREYGLNHWKPVLLGALAASDLFCDGGFTVLGSRDESIFDFSP